MIRLSSPLMAGLWLCLSTCFICLSLAAKADTELVDRSVLSIPTKPYQGTLEPTEEDSTVQFPTPVKAPEGAPNIVLVMTDDVGFGSVSTFGGSIPMPNLDKLAEHGLRYNQFHTTGICSPTRVSG